MVEVGLLLREEVHLDITTFSTVAYLQSNQVGVSLMHEKTQRSRREKNVRGKDRFT